MRFRPAGKVYTFDATEIECGTGDRVVVETERGMAVGTLASTPAEPSAPPAFPVKKILRPADQSDIARLEENARLEADARRACIDLIIEKKLDMKLLSVDAAFDRSKLLFFFAAEGRIDFRELVRDLARQFHTRIEMRQVGVRDEAKMIGGLGCCGRELCCATWLLEFAPISVRMAKSQNISLNPAKISGICGRLMCCLSYENKMYEDLSRNMPKVGKKVETPKGEGKVVRRNALEGTFTVMTQEGELEIKVEDFLASRKTQGGERFETPEHTVSESPEDELESEEEAETGARPEETGGAVAEGGGAAEGGAAPGSRRPGRRRRRRKKKHNQAREVKTDG